MSGMLPDGITSINEAANTLLDKYLHSMEPVGRISKLTPEKLSHYDRYLRICNKLYHRRIRQGYYHNLRFEETEKRYIELHTIKYLPPEEKPPKERY